ncbi:hypothetical protein [Streptomyces sp. NBC_00887]|nr:hypothetical protein OG844_46550 [Streptomyces sp. NBC_00887]
MDRRCPGARRHLDRINKHLTIGYNGYNNVSSIGYDGYNNVSSIG